MSTPTVITRINDQVFSHAVKTIAIAGLITGLLDATAAMAQGYFANGVMPDRVWKYVASGAVGRPAFSGGAGMVVLGLFCHFLIAFIFTTIFYFLYRRWHFLSVNIFITGMLWGLVVWTIMHFLVTPLSGTPPRRTPFNIATSWPQLLIHMFLVGLPMALVIHRLGTGKASGSGNVAVKE